LVQTGLLLPASREFPREQAGDAETIHPLSITIVRKTIDADFRILRDRSRVDGED
jgi:hypothetical protein